MVKAPTGTAARKRAETPRKVPDADGMRRNVKFSQTLVQAYLRAPGGREVACRPSAAARHAELFHAVQLEEGQAGVAEAFAAAREAGWSPASNCALAVAQAATEEIVTRDRLQVGTWLPAAPSTTRRGAEARPRPERSRSGWRSAFDARQFEKAIGPERLAPPCARLPPAGPALSKAARRRSSACIGLPLRPGSRARTSSSCGRRCWPAARGRTWWPTGAGARTRWRCTGRRSRVQHRSASYWHLLPEASQGRKAIWDAINPHTGGRRIDEAFPRDA